MMSIDDFFVKTKYKGEIYKTNNMLGQTLDQIVASADSTNQEAAKKKEQQKIESQMKTFEKSIWGNQARKDSLDSIAKVDKNGKKKAKKTTRRSSTSSSEVKSPKTKSKSSAVSAGSARVSVRRQRH